MTGSIEEDVNLTMSLNAIMTLVSNDEHEATLLCLWIDIIDIMAQCLEVIVGLSFSKHAAADYFLLQQLFFQ